MVILKILKDLDEWMAYYDNERYQENMLWRKKPIDGKPWAEKFSSNLN